MKSTVAVSHGEGMECIISIIQALRLSALSLVSVPGLWSQCLASGLSAWPLVSVPGLWSQCLASGLSAWPLVSVPGLCARPHADRLGSAHLICFMFILFQVFMISSRGGITSFLRIRLVVN